MASHARLAGKYGESLVLDHYLETLQSKPGALPGSTALAAARHVGSFTEIHDRYFEQARRRLGDADGTRALIDVLLAYRSLPADALHAGIIAALDIGVVDPQVVIIEARRHTSQRPDRNDVVVPIGNLARYDRPTPTLDRYDDLLLNKKAQ